MIWKEANKRFDEYGNDKIVGTNGFYAMKAHWNEHPERDEAWAEQERSRIGEERFRREHECEFLIFDETLFDMLPLYSSTTKGSFDFETVKFKKNTKMIK